MTELMTRKQYMEESSKVFREGGDTMEVHRRYYAQFVNESTVSAVSRHIGLDRLLASTDPHFNDIPLREWDSLCGFTVVGSRVMRFGPPAFPYGHYWKEVGDSGPALSDFGCIAKEAARQAVEQANMDKEFDLTCRCGQPPNCMAECVCCCHDDELAEQAQ